MKTWQNYSRVRKSVDMEKVGNAFKVGQSLIFSLTSKFLTNNGGDMNKHRITSTALTKLKNDF
jgi:hypothetical protein